MKRALILLLFAFSFVPVVGQNKPCNLTLKESPELRGVRLGMTPEEIDKALGIVVKPVFGSEAEKLAGVSTWLNGFSGAVEKQPEGIEALHFKFFERKLFHAAITYNTGANWKSSKEFASVLSEKLKLPDSWQHVDKNISVLNCTGFAVVLNIAMQPEIILSDAQASGLVEARLLKASADAEEKKKRDFKP